MGRNRAHSREPTAVVQDGADQPAANPSSLGLRLAGLKDVLKTDVRRVFDALGVAGVDHLLADEPPIGQKDVAQKAAVVVGF